MVVVRRVPLTFSPFTWHSSTTRALLFLVATTLPDSDGVSRTLTRPPPVAPTPELVPAAADGEAHARIAKVAASAAIVARRTWFTRVGFVIRASSVRLGNFVQK